MRGSGRRRPRRGQALIEFALVVPLLLGLIFGIIELSLVYSASALYDSGVRQAARVEALAGMSTGTIDQRTVKALEALVGSFPVAHVTQVEIFRSDAQGDGPRAGAENIYDAQGNPLSTQTWPVASRQSTIAAPVYLGVRVTYQYTWVTAFVGAMGTPLTLQATTVVPIVTVGG